MLNTTAQGLLAIVAGGLVSFVVWPTMADFYANANWDGLPAQAISQRNQVMTLWQFVPLFVGMCIFAYMFFRVGRRETTQESPDWL